jgi:hypothetical protein
MFAAVREPARLKGPLNHAVWVFASLTTLLFWFGFELTFQFFFRVLKISPQSELVFEVMLAATSAVLWVLTFFLLKSLLHARSFDLYWALCAVSVVYNTILRFLGREEQSWVVLTVANMDFALLVALLGLAYRKYNFVKVVSLIGFILGLSLLRHYLAPQLDLTTRWWLFAFNFLYWLAFSYAFLSEIDSIYKAQSSGR